MEPTPWVKIRCQVCGALMPPPFPRTHTAIANTHPVPRDPHGPRCRVVVIPDPLGSRHSVYPVPDGQTQEMVMERLFSSVLSRAA